MSSLSLFRPSIYRSSMSRRLAILAVVLVLSALAYMVLKAQGPWSFLLPAALVVAWRVRKRPGITLLLVHSLFVVGFFSISSEKRDLDVLPALQFVRQRPIGTEHRHTCGP